MRDPLPELGVGVVFAPGLEHIIEAGKGILDFIEVEPETIWLRSPEPERPYQLNPLALDALNRIDLPRTIHGVGFPVGGSLPFDQAQAGLFRETIAAAGAPWASEHLNINHVRRDGEACFAGFQLPPLQTPAGVAVAARNISQLRAQLPVPFAFETGANYLAPGPDELADGYFFRLVAQYAECGILLDLHNVWANARNGRQSVGKLIDELPLDAVWEIHLAGGRDFEGYWLDAHSGLIPSPLKELAATVVPRLANLKALTFEIVPDYISYEGIPVEALVEDLAWMKDLWQARGQRARASRLRETVELPACDEALQEVIRWEETLDELLRSDVDGRQAKRTGAHVYRNLINTGRSSVVVSGLRLSTRLMRLSLGEHVFDDLLRDYLSQTRPRLFASDEIEQFAELLTARCGSLPHLEELVSFELAAQRRLIEGAVQPVKFSCEPRQLMDALCEGRLPFDLQEGAYELVVD